MSIDQVVAQAKVLRALDLAHSSKEEISTELQKLLDLSSYGAMGIPLAWKNTWYRGRSLRPDEGIRNRLQELIYPEQPSKKYGRLSYPEQRIFYASSNRATVLGELSPDEGQRVQFINCRPRPNADVRVTVIGAFEQFYFSGRVHYSSSALEHHLDEFFSKANQDEIKITLYVDAFLASLFRDADGSIYPLTSAIANRVFSSDIPCGLIYPSVRAVAGWNLAIPDRTFDDCFEVLATDAWEVGKSHGYGVYDLSQHTSPTHVFGADGSIHLNPTIIVRAPRFSLASGLEYPPDAPSWRVPKGSAPTA